MFKRFALGALCLAVTPLPLAFASQGGFRVAAGSTADTAASTPMSPAKRAWFDRAIADILEGAPAGDQPHQPRDSGSR